MQASGCTRGGGHRTEWKEAGPVTSDREGGTESWGKKVGQRQKDKRQKFRKMDREKVEKQRYPDT